MIFSKLRVDDERGVKKARFHSAPAAATKE